jgi:hypothetical protein
LKVHLFSSSIGSIFANAKHWIYFPLKDVWK